MAVIRPNAEPAATSVAAGDIFLIDGSTGVRALAASVVPILDANGNVSINNISDGFSSTATVAGTTTLTAASAGQQFFTGTLGQTVVLPVVSTLPAIGVGYFFQNSSTGSLTVQSSGGNVVKVLAPGTFCDVTCIALTGTSAASWQATYFADIVVSGKVLTLNNSLTLAGTDGTVMTFPTTSASVARTDAAQTFTGTQTFGAVVGTSLALGGATLGSNALAVTGTALFNSGLQSTSAIFKAASGTTTLQIQDGVPSSTTTIALSSTLLKISDNALPIEFDANTNGGNSGQLVLNSNGSNSMSGALTLSGALTYGGVILNNAVSGTGNMALTAGTTFTGTTTIATLAATTLGGTITAAGNNITGIGALTATTLNGNTFTAGTGTFTLGAGKTHTVSNSLTFTGTDATSFAFPGASDTVVTLAAAQSLTNKTIAGAALSGTLSGTPTFSGANFITRANLAQVAASSLSGNPTGALANEAAVTLGTTLNFSGTTLNATTATTSQLGAVKPDGTTITIAAGVITAVGAAATAVSVGTTTISSAVGNGPLTSASGVLGNVLWGQLPGEPSTGSATAGNVGEYISSNVAQGSAVPLTTNTGVNVTSISLTAGDWDVSGNVCYNPAGSTVSANFWAAISLVSATLPAPPNAGGISVINPSTSGGSTAYLQAGTLRVSVASTTTVYLIGQSSFSVSTSSAFGAIHARRMR